MTHKENNEEKKNVSIFTVSDGTGETGLNIVKAVRVQFPDADIHIERFNKIRTREKLEWILQAAKLKSALLVATLVDPELRVFLISRSMQLEVKVVDLLFPLLEALSVQIGHRPTAIPGLLRQLDADYFKRISAMEFTVHHDDGILSNDIDDADIILVGVSRTSKTPLSMYLGHKGYKVANVPIIPDVVLPDKLFQVNQDKIIGLVIDPTRLAEIRGARMNTAGAKNMGDYANPDKIFEELEWSRELFKKNKRWPVFDVTGKALEEIAVEIESVILNRFPELESIQRN